MAIMVTGDNGMIGSKLASSLLDAGYRVVGIDRTKCRRSHESYKHYQIDLNDRTSIESIIQNEKVDRIIHLAALAHTENEPDISWDRYYHINVECAKNVFSCAENRPVLFISTIDVYGFFDGKTIINENTRIKPVSNYAKSKAIAESACRELSHYTIFRLSPVYSDEIKRDIQKRYYLKYPFIAYQVGKGSYFEVLNIDTAVDEMVKWCKSEPMNNTRIIKDQNPMWTPDYIKAEKEAGRARIVFHIPKWAVTMGYGLLKKIFGENETIYLLNKAVYPLHTDAL